LTVKTVSTPLTARLVEMIHEIEDGRRAMETANLDVLKGVYRGAERQSSGEN